MKKILLTFSISLSSLLLCNQNASATVVINNLVSGSQSFAISLSGPTATGILGFPFINRELAFSFTTGTSTVLLTELAFNINIGNSQLSPVQFDLSTGSSAPGGTGTIGLGSVAPTSTSPTAQLLTLNIANAPTLDPNTLYWLHVTVPSGGAIYSFSNSDAPVVDPEWSLGNTWYRQPSTSWTELDSGPKAKIRMTVQSVPEPCVPMFSGVALLLLLIRRRA